MGIVKEGGPWLFIHLKITEINEKEKIDYDAGRCCGSKYGNGTGKWLCWYHIGPPDGDKLL